MKPRILHVTGEGFGGGSVLIKELALAAHASGFQVDVLATDPRFIDYLDSSSIEVIDTDFVRREIKPGHDVVATRLLKQLMLRNRYQIVHTHTTKGGFLGRLAAWSAHVPIVLHTVHGFAFHEQTPPLQLKAMSRLEQFAAGKCHRVITVSEFHRDWALRLGIGDSSKVVAIPNGINEERVRTALTRNDARSLLGLDASDRVVLYFGRLAAQKGIEHLLAAVESMPETESVLCLIVGDGPLRTELERQAAHSRARDKVRFLGFTSDVSIPLRAADVVALPSLREGLSISLLEAMAAGKPIVTTSISSNKEVTQDGKCAVLVPPADHQRLARALESLLGDQNRTQLIGAAALERFRNTYTQDRMLDSYMSLYQNPLGYAVP